MTTARNIHFVTGKLAEPIVRYMVQQVAESQKFDYSIAVLPITVAALMTPKWLLRHLAIPDDCDLVIIPGHLADYVEEIDAAIDTEIQAGPRDIRNLAMFFGAKPASMDDYGDHSIEIIAEINHAPRLSRKELLTTAKSLIAEGADRIDLGCDPNQRWLNVAGRVKELRDEGIALSIDTFDPREAADAAAAGVDLVLSVNSSNRQQCVDWGVEVVVVPDDLNRFESNILETVEFLEKNSISYRVDPILEPIGCGLATSIHRYHQIRKILPEVQMLMGIGNLTELTDADSAGINMMLLGICEELSIHSVLTTQVINWARTAVRECVLARRAVHYAVRHRLPPKHLEQQLVMLRDPKVTSYPSDVVEQLAADVRDNNYRILINNEEIHLISAGVHIRGIDPFEMMGRLMEMPQSENIDPSHAFYLGFELAKALTALTVGKQYDQDVALNWGMLTRKENLHRLPRQKKSERIAPPPKK